MFGFAQVQEKRRLRAEVVRAQRALEAARMQPLTIQQDIARLALQECVVTMARLSIAKPNKDQQSLYALRLAELEQTIKAAELESESDELDPAGITAILAQTLLAISSGSRGSDDLESVGRKIADWSHNILPDFDQLRTQLTH